MMRKPCKVISFICAVICTVFIGFSAFTVEEVKAENLNLHSSESEVLSQISTLKSDSEKLIKEGNNLIDEVKPENVSDPETLKVLSSSLNTIEDGLEFKLSKIPDGKGYDCFSENLSLKSSLKKYDEKKSLLQKNKDNLSNAISKVEEFKLQKDTENAKSALKEMLESAKKKLNDSEGKVADNNTRQKLEEYITSAEGSISSGKISELNSLSTSLRSSVESVDKSIQKQQEIEAERERRASEARYASQQAAQQAAQNGGEAVQADDGTWYVDYSVDYHSYSFGDGVTEWEDGYYVAHNNTSSGQNIASQPGTVVVDGVSYRYVSSMVVPEGTNWQDVEGFVHANGGIGFQTCTDGGYLITHYEPY